MTDYPCLEGEHRVDVVIVGGANYSGRESLDIAAEMRPSMEAIFPRLKGVEIEYGWSGMIRIVINRIP